MVLQLTDETRFSGPYLGLSLDETITLTRVLINGTTWTAVESIKKPSSGWWLRGIGIIGLRVA